MTLLLNLKTRSTILFSALNNTNYRWYWFATFFSSMSSGINLITQGWLVLEMTGDPLWVGLLAGITGVAQISFGTFGGVIVDRWNKRITIMILQFYTGLLGLMLTILLIYNNLELWHLAVAAMFNGILQSIRIPTGNSIVFSIVVVITTSPVCTFTNLNMIVTISCLYCLFACMPKILAPIPPDLISLS